jgi:hypothetical protein
MEGADSLIYRARPWSISSQVLLEEHDGVGPIDATIVMLQHEEAAPRDSASLPGLRNENTKLYELRLPLGSKSVLRSRGIPTRPPIGKEPITNEEHSADRALRRLEEMHARVHELEIANDDPQNIWDRLADFWRAAESNSEPLVSEIVLQASHMPRRLKDILEKLRRVLRRERAMVALDRAQEMDQASMIWLTRQPGNTLAERAGPAQRVQAVVRKESYDTGENRVVHAWCCLADAAARDWLRHNLHAKSSRRFIEVEKLRRLTRMGVRDLEELKIGVAQEDQLPNFVLTQDPDYREVYEAWRRLLNEKRRLDELWAWQSRTWSDFCALAVTLSVRAIDEARLVASSPVVLFNDHDRGAWFGADRPLAVYFLEKQRLVVEVQYRPRFVSKLQEPFAAPIWLRIGSLNSMENARRIPVWPRLVFSPVSLRDEADLCAKEIGLLARQAQVYRALIIHSDPTVGVAVSNSVAPLVTSVGIAPSGTSLLEGFNAIGKLLREEVRARENYK